MLWPNPAVTLLFARVSKPLIKRHQKVVEAAFQRDRFLSIKREGPVPVGITLELAHLELIRVLLDQVEFVERYTQISILYLYSVLGFATEHEIDVLRGRPWQV